MAHLFVRHPVKDYEMWRQVYDEADALREEFGVRSHTVFQSADDPNDITVMHVFDNIGAAKAMAEAPQLREAMDQAGVAAPPTIWFVNKK